ncbi:DUF805 domain-containing protein [Kytococcus sp. Marseille-QA3725]
MDPIQAFGRCIARYADFRDRARRSELWGFLLVAWLLTWAAEMLDGLYFEGTELTLGLESVDPRGPVTLALHALLLLPTLAVGTRRLHDTGRTGWWMLSLLTLLLVPLGEPGVVVALWGLFLLAFWWVGRSQAGTNRFGPHPRDTARHDLLSPPRRPRAPAAPPMR